MNIQNEINQLPTDTRERILDVSERLFAQRGLDNVSIRDITGAAGANLGAVNYHFTNKEGLIEAIFERRLVPINRERMALLDELEQLQPPAEPSVEQILLAIIRPVLRDVYCQNQGRAFMKLIGRSLSEPHPVVGQLLKRHFDPLCDRINAMLLKALPHLNPGEVFWRMKFTFGAMHHWLLLGEEWIPDWAKESQIENQVQRLITFAAAGMRAALPNSSKSN